MHSYIVVPCPQDWLTSIEIKYYESKVNLNWKNILKSIKEVRWPKLGWAQ